MAGERNERTEFLRLFSVELRVIDHLWGGPEKARVLVTSWSIWLFHCCQDANMLSLPSYAQQPLLWSRL